MCLQKNKPIAPEISLKISVFSLLMTAVVVLHHSCFRNYYPFLEDIGPVSTAYFFYVSAFFLYRGIDAENMAGRIKKRFASLVLPYFLWNVIYILLYYVLYDNYRPSARDMLSLFTVSPLCASSWYLLTLFIFTLAAPLIRPAYRRISSTFLLLLAGILVSLTGYVWFQETLATVPFVGGYLVRMAEYLPAYLAGGALGVWLSAKMSVGKRLCMGGLCVSVCILLLLWKAELSPEIRLLFWTILPVVLWESIPECIFRNWAGYRILSAPAFFIIMSHGILLNLLNRLPLAFLQENSKIREGCVVMTAVGMAYLIYYLLKSICPGVLNILTGGRNRKN